MSIHRLPKSVLIVRLSAIGDVVHALPLLDVLRAQLPDAKIGWLAEELAAPLLENHPALDRLYVIPKKRWRGRYHKVFRGEMLPFFREIRREKWEAAIDCQGLTKSGLAAVWAGARTRAGFAGENSREVNWMFMTRRIKPLPEDVHVAQQNVRLVEGIGLKVPEALPEGTVYFSDEEILSIQKRLKTAGWNGEPLMAVNAGGGFPSKLWEPEKYGRLGALIAKKTGFRPIIFWGPKEEGMRDRLYEDLKMFDAIKAPPTSIRESAVLTAQCRLFVGGDTGPSQIAGMLGIPVLAVFGSTSGERNRPWHGSDSENVLYIQREDLWCVPCQKDRCPLAGEAFMACLRGLEAEAVFERAEAWLEKVVQ